MSDADDTGEIDELDALEIAFRESQRRTREAPVTVVANHSFVLLGNQRDELNDRTGCTRRGAIDRSLPFTRVVKDRSPLWIPFRILCNAKRQVVITNRSDGRENRYTNYTTYVWDHDSDCLRLFRFNQQSMNSLRSLSLSGYTFNKKLLAYWQPFGLSFREASEQPEQPDFGIVGYSHIVQECHRLLDNVSGEIDRRNPAFIPTTTPTPDARVYDIDIEGNVTRERGIPSDAHGDDVELAELLGSLGSSVIRDDPHLPRRGRKTETKPETKPMQPPPGKMGGRKLDLD